MRQKRWEQRDGGSKNKGMKFIDWSKEALTTEPNEAAFKNDEPPSTFVNSPEPSDVSTPYFRGSQTISPSLSHSPSSLQSPLTKTLDPQHSPSHSCRTTESAEIGKGKQRQLSATFHPTSPHRADTFDCLPSNMTPRDLELATYYLQTLPSTNFNILGPNICNPMTDPNIRAAIRDSAVLHALILSYAARHQAHMWDLSETAESASHKSKAAYLINQRLSVNPSSPSDRTVLAALALTSLEDRWGNYDMAWVHMRGVMQMIRNRGGPEDFGEIWILSLLSGYLILSCLLLSWNTHTSANQIRINSRSKFSKLD
jgi:hypothetical protein